MCNGSMDEELSSLAARSRSRIAIALLLQEKCDPCGGAVIRWEEHCLRAFCGEVNVLTQE